MLMLLAESIGGLNGALSPLLVVLATMMITSGGGSSSYSFTGKR